MSDIRLVDSEDEALYERIEHEIPEERIEACLKMGKQMVNSLQEEFTNGIALAAPQVGVRERFFVFADGRMFLNPRIDSPKTDRSKMLPKYFDHPTFPHGEGCLSFPGKQVEVPRWEKILASWIDENGVLHERERLKGIESHVFQHEFDHLEGICIVRNQLEVSDE